MAGGRRVLQRAWACIRFETCQRGEPGDSMRRTMKVRRGGMSGSSTVDGRSSSTNAAHTSATSAAAKERQSSTPMEAGA